MIVNPADSGTIITDAIDAITTQLKTAYGKAGAALVDLVNDEAISADDRLRLLKEVYEILTGTRTGFTPGSTPSLALGAGSPSTTGVTPEVQDVYDRLGALASSIGVTDADQLITNLAGWLAPVANLTDPNKVKARLNGMALVADGTTPVNSDGTIDHSSAVAAVQQELDNERDVNHGGSLAKLLDKAQADLQEERDDTKDGSLAKQVKTVTRERDNAVNAANAAIPKVNDAVTDLVALQAAVAGNSRLKRELGKANLRPEFKTALGL